MRTFTKSSVEAMANYVRTSKYLQHIRWNVKMGARSEEILCCFLRAFQETTSLKDLNIDLPVTDGPSDLAFENMLTHTHSLRPLKLIFPVGLLEDITVATARSGLKKNITLRELTLEFSEVALTLSPIMTSLRDHPLLQRLLSVGMRWISPDSRLCY
jgi:hypothetical protein